MCISDYVVSVYVVNVPVKGRAGRGMAKPEAVTLDWCGVDRAGCSFAVADLRAIARGHLRRTAGAGRLRVGRTARVLAGICAGRAWLAGAGRPGDARRRCGTPRRGRRYRPAGRTAVNCVGLRRPGSADGAAGADGARRRRGRALAQRGGRAATAGSDRQRRRLGRLRRPAAAVRTGVRATGAGRRSRGRSGGTRPAPIRLPASTGIPALRRDPRENRREGVPGL
jgi:hypothetical protein